MDPRHHPLMPDAAQPPGPRILCNRIRRKLHFHLARLTAKPPTHLVLIGRPGSGKILLSEQIILIEAATPKPKLNLTLQSAFDLISKSIRTAARNLKTSAGADNNPISAIYNNENSSTAV